MAGGGGSFICTVIPAYHAWYQKIINIVNVCVFTQLKCECFFLNNSFDICDPRVAIAKPIFLAQ